MITVKRLPSIARPRAQPARTQQPDMISVQMTQAQAEQLGIVYYLSHGCGHHPSLHHAVPNSISSGERTACSSCGCKEYQQGVFIEACPLIRAQ